LNLYLQVTIATVVLRS